MTNDDGLQVDRLDALLAQRGWGSSALAQHAGVSYNYVYRIRTMGAPSISGTVVARLALALDTSADYLLGLTDDPSPPGQQRYPVAAPVLARPVARLNSLSPALQAITAGILEALFSFGEQMRLGDGPRARRLQELLEGMTEEQYQAFRREFLQGTQSAGDNGGHAEASNPGHSQTDRRSA